jgi:hypothetical protein
LGTKHKEDQLLNNINSHKITRNSELSSYGCLHTKVLEQTAGALGKASVISVRRSLDFAL